ncbi:MAG: DUF1343 domain-containing protein [Bacteroidales bacterium]|nr:DUF1343 domain-containing protein [Bacteroidales bacterium]
MFSFRTTDLKRQEDILLNKGNISFICNQSSWNPNIREYPFEEFSRRGNLVSVFVPSGDTLNHHPLSSKIPFKSIKRDINGYAFNIEDFAKTDAIIVEMQDAGCRYFGAPNLTANLITFLHNADSTLPLYIVDRPNPSGRLVEGTPLTAGYRSGFGVETVPHRYGLTLGELAYYVYQRIGAKFPIHIISAKCSPISKLVMPWSIPLAENYGNFFTSAFYTGQYLWKATNISNAEGTIRPYEMFGAPFLQDVDFESHSLFKDDGVYVRWCSFIPHSGLHKERVCFGYQLLLTPQNQYHELSHALRLIRCANDLSTAFQFNKTEEGQDCSMAEMLIGDKELLDFTQGKLSWDEVKEHIKLEEQKWIKKAKKFLLYEEEPLFRIK